MVCITSGLLYYNIYRLLILLHWQTVGPLAICNNDSVSMPIFRSPGKVCAKGWGKAGQWSLGMRLLSALASTILFMCTHATCAFPACITEKLRTRVLDKIIMEYGSILHI